MAVVLPMQSDVEQPLVHSSPSQNQESVLVTSTWSERLGPKYWIHQIMRAKVLRHLFTHLPDHIPSAESNG